MTSNDEHTHAADNTQMANNNFIHQIIELVLLIHVIVFQFRV